MKNPRILEINTWVWLNELTQKHGQAITLQNVSSGEWDEFARLGINYLWLMGVWKRSPAGLKIALQNPAIINACQHTLPDFTPADMVGSPFCVRDYSVDGMLGGAEGILTARNELNSRGIRLLVDFVPNHVAPDHPWTKVHTEYFIQGTIEELSRRPGDFMRINKLVIARARDPFYPPWPDVIQVNAFSPALRNEYAKLLLEVASMCDGLRCDMAMLMTNRIFEETWGERAGEMTSTEFWAEIIPEIKKRYPEFIFIAEVYWDMEWELQQQGFDYCYDKRLYDRLLGDTPFSISQHLQADTAFQEKLVRFIENHDEQRIASQIEAPQQQSAAVIISTLPGARLYHHGQFEGKKTRIPVFLARSLKEPVDHNLENFYQRLLNLTSQPLFRDGNWTLCSVNGWTGSHSCQNLLAWSWSLDHQKALIIINYSDNPAQGRVEWPWAEDHEKELHLDDVLHQRSYVRSCRDLMENGLYVDLNGWDFHLFVF